MPDRVVVEFAADLGDRTDQAGWWLEYLGVFSPEACRRHLPDRWVEAFNASPPLSPEERRAAVPRWDVPYDVAGCRLVLADLDAWGAAVVLGDAPDEPIAYLDQAHPMPTVFRWDEAVRIAELAQAHDDRWASFEGKALPLLLPFVGICHRDELQKAEEATRPFLEHVGLTDRDLAEVFGGPVRTEEFTGPGWVEDDELGWTLDLVGVLPFGATAQAYSFRRRDYAPFPALAFRALLDALASG